MRPKRASACWRASVQLRGRRGGGGELGRPGHAHLLATLTAKMVPRRAGKLNGSGAAFVAHELGSALWALRAEPQWLAVGRQVRVSGSATSLSFASVPECPLPSAQRSLRARINSVSPGQSQKTPWGDRDLSSSRTSLANSSTRSPNRCGADQEKEK